MSKIDLLEWTTLSDFNVAISDATDKVRKDAARVYGSYKNGRCSGSFVRDASRTVSWYDSMQHRINDAVARVRAAYSMRIDPTVYAGDPYSYTTYASISDDTIRAVEAAVVFDGVPCIVASVDTKYDEHRGRWVSAVLLACYDDYVLKLRRIVICDRPPFKLP